MSLNSKSTLTVEEVAFAPGDFLFSEGETSYHFFIIQSGKVEVFKTGPKGEKIPLAVVEDSQSLGEFAMIDRQPRSASAQAISTVRAAKISATAYQQMLSSLPGWAVTVLQGLVGRLRQTNDILKRHGIVDEKILTEIEAVEFDTDSKISSTP